MTIPALDAPPVDAAASEVLHGETAVLLDQLATDAGRERAPAEVAEALGTADVRGLGGGSVSHPLARWLTRRLGPGASAWVAGRGGSVHVVRDQAAEALVPLPLPVREFVGGFDTGFYPDLVLPLGPDLTEQVRCGCGYLLPASEALAGFTSCEWCATGRPSPLAAAAGDAARCRVCDCTEAAGCRWATAEELLAAGVEPMDGDVCTGCVRQYDPVAIPAPLEAHRYDPVAIPAPLEAHQYDTVSIPLPDVGPRSRWRRRVRAGRDDSGQVLARIAVVCGWGAAAAFGLAAGDVWMLPGAVLALGWPVATVLLLFLRPAPRREYAARHGAGHRPVHAAWAGR